MGKKKSTFKNIMVTLGCTAFAGVYVLGGGYVISTFMDGANGTRPAWLERVEIHVDENASENIVADNSLSGSVIAGAAGVEGARNVDNAPTGQSSDSGVNHNGNNDKSSSGDTLQKPRFEEEETDETDTETDEAESETDLESETDDEQSEEAKDETDGKSADKKEEKEERKDSVQVSHVKVIDQEDQALAVMADVTAVVKTAMPCVVSITNEYTAYDYWYDEEYDEQANGSGIVVAQSDEELLIVTNYHVVEDNNNLYVQFIDEEEAIAYVKGTSPENDLAIVSVFLEDMSDKTLESIAIAALGDSDSLQVGEPAIAIGNSLGYGQSVTTGVISALNRNVFADDPDMIPGYLIQTDAAINPGNSGGALLNVRGEVIGINSSKIADYVIEGMGYAIPISTAKPIIEDLMQKETRKKVPEDERAFLGIAGTDVIKEATARYDMPEGVYVNNVLEDTAADEAGILKGDIIMYIDGEKITRMEELQGLLEYYAAGTKVEVVLMRQSDGEYKERTVDVMLGYKE
ncbi:MAG: trypsin-like peptidase domain-containing protein [Lachnospiraceae bacterium]|nr:trypsin-like peptidase domain-containing protein [Lachnospiraceae bacterium]